MRFLPAAALAAACLYALATPPSQAGDSRLLYQPEAPDWLRAVGKLDVFLRKVQFELYKRAKIEEFFPQDFKLL